METKKLPSWHQRLFPLIAVIGILDTFYLINVHNNPGVCSVNDTLLPLPIDCGTVSQSKYANLFGIPLAYLGFIYYLAIVIVFLYRSDITFLPVDGMMVLSIILGTGMLFSIYLVYLQIGVLKLICLYCMGSALSTTVLFSMHFFQVLRK